jgi:3-dehydroquinate synthase
LGGGVVGDLAGFAAASVLRGIAFVQIPTTVLAMVDSAIGGKTGVDHPVGKNLVGAFHQPRLVLADTTVLTTLSPAERAAGWAEAIKHGVIGDPALFADLAEHSHAALALQEPVTGQLIQRAAAYKARVVSGDEREQGGRIMLNYGHTIGHALEAESNYTMRHGEAIAVGMMAAGTIAQRVGLFDSSALAEQRTVLEQFGLPTHIPSTIDPTRIIARIGSDKKVRAKRVRWVLPTAIGKTVVRDDIPLELVAEVVEELKLG